MIKRIWVYGLLLLLAFVSCDEPNTTSQEQANTAAGSIVPNDYTLVQRDFPVTGITVLVPEEFSIRIKDSLQQGSAGRLTWKYMSSEDSASAVGIALGINDGVQMRHLKQFMDNMEKEARAMPKLRRVNRSVKRINGQDFGCLQYAEFESGKEVNYAAMAATVLDSNLLTLHVFFAGPVKRSYEQTADSIIASIKYSKE